MSIKTKIAALAIATLTTVGGMTASSQQAHAGPGVGFGVAAGILGAAVIGSAIASGPAYAHGYGYGYAPRRCFWTRGYDAYGYPVRVRTCNF